MNENQSFSGFDVNVQQASEAFHKTSSLSLQRIEDIIKSRFSTSTPFITPRQGKMNCMFSKESVASLQSTDDSGFVSNTHESNESITIDKSGNTSSHDNNCLYISEDALQEKPASAKRPSETESVYEEFSHLYYLNSIIESSVSSPDVAKSVSETLSGSASDTSLVLPLQSPIYVYDNSTSLDKENVDPNLTLSNMNNFLCDKPSISRRNILTETPQKSSVKSIDPNISPELFSEGGSGNPTPQKVDPTNKPSNFEPYQLEIDNKLAKTINKALTGVLPPPNLTVLQLTVDEMLEKINLNQNLLDLNSSHFRESNQSLINTDLDQCQITKWPHILNLRYHGLHYNTSKLSEDISALCVRYGQRFIGAETQSSCTVFDAHASLSSPAKRRLSAAAARGGGGRWCTKSPGRRLSHLARRRITFSSSSLQQGGAGRGVGVAGGVVGGGPSTSAVNGGGAHARQIMVDSKRFELLQRKKTISPRKRTPRKSPRKRVRTPSSSTKKLEFKVRRLNSAEEVVTSFSGGIKATKRALFQSPDKSEPLVSRISQSQLKPSMCNSSLSPWKRRPTPRLALFTSSSSPPDRSNDSTSCSTILSTASDSRLASCTSRKALFTSPVKKRKRLDSVSEEEEFGRRSMQQQQQPLPRSISLEVPSGSGSGGGGGAAWTRVRSAEVTTAGSGTTALSVHHKKKLQWAVYEALRSQQIGLSHPNFKQFAATLARVTRRFLPNLSASAPRPEGGTSERMLRIARQHVYAVTKGKTVEEILQAKGV